jgi:SAM-dependent methyltransferase
MTAVDWFRRAFGADYLRVYRHRDEASARREVAFVLAVAAPPSGARVLDLACGAGRHARPLAAAGHRVAAVDLSPELLAEARTGGVRSLVRADMRSLPFRSGAFDLAASFFTSFGYFASEADDGRMLADIARALRSRGRYFIDYLNPTRVRASLVPRSERVVDGLHVLEERSIDPTRRRVEKRVTIEGGDDGPTEYVESVRLYEPEELVAVLADAGLATVGRWGDFDGSALGAQSPRTLLLAERTS